MNRSMIMCVTLPLALAFIGCTDDGGQSDTADGDEADTGITTLGTETTADGGTETTDDGPTTDDTTTTATGDTTTATTDGPNCGEVSIVPTYVPPNVMFVVDASGSMVNNSWDDDLDPNTPDVTRWNTLHGVVDAVMNQFGAAMGAGLQRFPSADACLCYGAGGCVVGDQPEVNVTLDNGAAILAAMPGANADDTEIVGGTPATKGIQSAVDHLLTLPAENPRYIVLITDGAANCDPTVDQNNSMALMEDYDETLPVTVEDANMNDGITTFVVGIDIIDQLVGQGGDGAPEANPFEKLNEVALAGGAPKNEGMDAEKFFNSTNQAELLGAIELILGEVTECIIDLSMTEEGAPDPSQIPFVTFEVDGNEVPKVDDCENEDGWTWLEEGVVMTFCGSYCEDFKNGTAEFDGTYGCPPAG